MNARPMAAPPTSSRPAPARARPYAWNPGFALGVPEVDDDHRRYIAMLDEIHGALARGDARERVALACRQLVAYTVRHFSAEERFLREIGYPGYREHRRQHVWFVGWLREAGSGALLEDPGALAFMRDWLFDHIIGADRRYVAWALRHVGARAERYAGVAWAFRRPAARLS